jgi:hypothetical protein
MASLNARSPCGARQARTAVLLWRRPELLPHSCRRSFIASLFVCCVQDSPRLAREPEQTADPHSADSHGGRAEVDRGCPHYHQPCMYGRVEWWVVGALYANRASGLSNACDSWGGLGRGPLAYVGHDDDQEVEDVPPIPEIPPVVVTEREREKERERERERERDLTPSKEANPDPPLERHDRYGTCRKRLNMLRLLANSLPVSHDLEHGLNGKVQGEGVVGTLRERRECVGLHEDNGSRSARYEDSTDS